MTVRYDQLPFPLSGAVSLNPAELPLPFTRKHGQTVDIAPPDNGNGDNGNGGDAGSNKIPVVGRDYFARYDATGKQSNGWRAGGQSAKMFSALNGLSVAVLDISHCLSVQADGLSFVAACHNTRTLPVTTLAKSYQHTIAAALDMVAAHQQTVGISQLFVTQRWTPTSSHLLLNSCLHAVKSRLNALQTERAAMMPSHDLATSCQQARYQAVVIPPCEYYPIPLDDKDNNDNASKRCQHIHPKELALPLTRLRLPHDTAQLPFPLACHFKLDTPLLRGYMFHQIVTCKLGDKSLNPLSARISTSMSSFCWQAEIALPPDDFALLNLGNRESHDRPEISMSAAGYTFAFIVESVSDTRKFGERSYTVSCRSKTAYLGADYTAANNSGMVVSDRYARQIAEIQLAEPFAIGNWTLTDWLIKGGSYAITDKTPVDVLKDIAEAAGGFVSSHINQPIFNMLPRWRVAAWKLAETEADMVVPANVIESISGSDSFKQRCNGVYIHADHANGKGGNVYRDGSNQEPRAATKTHALYTDLPVLEAAGLAALSDTGYHRKETVKWPLSTKYGLALAELGKIVEIREPSGNWRGVVESVSIDIAMHNDVPTVWQTAVIDRYMGD